MHDSPLVTFVNRVGRGKGMTPTQNLLAWLLPITAIGAYYLLVQSTH